VSFRLTQTSWISVWSSTMVTINKNISSLFCLELNCLSENFVTVVEDHTQNLDVCVSLDDRVWIISVQWSKLSKYQSGTGFYALSWDYNNMKKMLYSEVILWNHQQRATKPIWSDSFSLTTFWQQMCFKNIQL